MLPHKNKAEGHRRGSGARLLFLIGRSPLLLFVLLAVAAARLHSEPPPVYTPAVSVTGGDIVGIVQDGVRSYKGIPFAAPPVGPNRWKAPQPVVPWKRVRQAVEYGPAPMQDKAAAQMMGGPGVTVSEDCLYLNIWTPAARKGAKLPVMVWIYGGGFAAGATSNPTTDGTRLAKHGVVVVSVAYRVGPFGFLATPALSKESGHGSGTYGLMDQIAGLGWVKQNIAQFGGDPGCVTIFGESAGGESTSTLAASPQAHGLFQRVICESGSSFAPTRYGSEFGDMVPSLGTAETLGAAFLHKLGADDLAAARALPADTIQKAASSLKGYGFWPARDGYVQPDDQYRMYEAGRFNDTPVLLGTNSDDGGMFSPTTLTSTQFEGLARAVFGGQAGAILAAYPHGTDAQAVQAVRHLVRDITFAWGTWSWARLQSRHVKSAAYLYYFDHYSAKTPDGAEHAAELPYVFGFQDRLDGLSAREDEALSDKMQRYWVNFARTGNPNGPGLTPWPAFREPDAQALVFDTGISAHPVPHLAQLRTLDDYFAERRAAEPAPLVSDHSK